MYAAQVIMDFEKPTVVRLNDEVKARVTATLPRTATDDGRIDLGELESISGIELTESDPNAGHLTLLRSRDGWAAAFDFQYNASRIQHTARVAREYLDSAASSLAQQHYYAFADSLLSAAELMARAILLGHDHELLAPKPKNKHRLIAAHYDRWAELGNSDPRFAALLRELWQLRPDARYLESALVLTSTRAEELIALGEEMYAHLLGLLPARVR
jgi:uncharacterized protein (UPF0332 family)